MSGQLAMFFALGLWELVVLLVVVAAVSTGVIAALVLRMTRRSTISAEPDEPHPREAAARGGADPSSATEDDGEPPHGDVTE